MRGVTADGYLIYSDDAALTLHALPLAGGSAQSLGALGSKFWVTVVGDVVFAWSNVTGADVGALAVWSSQSGLHTVSSNSLGIDATTSAAGDRILYVDQVDSQAAAGDVYLANVDGSNAQRLLAAVSLDGCYPQLGFSGSDVVVSFCPTPQNGTPNATVSVFTAPTFGRSDLAANAANYWTMAPSPLRVLVSTPAGVVLVPVGSAPVTIDPDGFFGSFGDNGQTVFYSTRSHAFRRSPASAPAPVTLVPNDFGGAYSLSPDQKWVLYFWNFGATGSDLFLASAVAPSTPVTLLPAQSGAVLGDAFTTDSSHALYASELDVCNQTGTLHAYAVGGGNAVLGQGVFAEHALDGGRVVFTDNYAVTGGLRFGRADIELVDLAQGTAPKRLVSRADAVFGLSPAQDQLIYSWSARTDVAGIYVTPLK